MDARAHVTLLQRIALVLLQLQHVAHIDAAKRRTFPYEDSAFLCHMLLTARCMHITKMDSVKNENAMLIIKSETLLCMAQTAPCMCSRGAAIVRCTERIAAEGLA